MILQRPAAQAGFGLFATFHDEDETVTTPPSALGPFDELTIRSTHVVAERAEVGTVIAARGANGRWRAADPETQRALQAAGGDASRGHIRAYTEARDLYVRVFDDEPERSPPVPELGPFSVVDVGIHELRADLLVLAVRVSTMAPWLLTDSAGPDLAGVARRVLALRARSSRPAPAAPPPQIVGSIEARERSPAATDVAVPHVWVDRVRPAPEIYISRPDIPRKR